MLQEIACNHARIVLFLAVALHWEIQDGLYLYEQYFEQDLDYCYHCFEHQIDACDQFHFSVSSLVNNKVTGPIEALTDLLRVAGEKRTSSILRYYKTGQPFIMAKHYGRHRPTTTLFAKSTVATKLLLHYFIVAPRLDGVQVCPQVTASVPRFVSTMLQMQPKKPHDLDEFTVMLHMLDNVQPVLAAVLYSRHFPVPRFIARCGFTYYEAYAGRSLVHYYDAPTPIKLDIARQLLFTSIIFTEGIEGFRLYLTDLTADNLVYDEQTHRLTVVDMDTLLIVDSEVATRLQTLTPPWMPPTTPTTHRHDYIDCDNCFAFSPKEICSHPRSDFNLFAACQFLREDLQRNRKKGFLGDILTKRAYVQVAILLDECMHCLPPICLNRFQLVYALIETLDDLLIQGIYNNN